MKRIPKLIVSMGLTASLLSGTFTAFAESSNPDLVHEMSDIVFDSDHDDPGNIDEFSDAEAVHEEMITFDGDQIDSDPIYDVEETELSDESLQAEVMDASLDFAGGSGTEEDPYQVSTPEQLNNVRKYLSANFIQINDIDMTEATSEGGAYWNNGAGWTPIGNGSKKFTGSYDGADYSITGLFCNAEYAGFFGYNNSATVKNVNLTGTIIGGKNTYAGGVVAFNYNGSVTNCSFDGTLSAPNSTVGGIVGNNTGTVANCINNADITASGTYAGGIIGYNNSSSDITNCYNNGALIGTTRAGGIVGGNSKAKITNCGNTGNIRTVTKSSNNVCFGGIAGSTDGNITQCYNLGNISSSIKQTTLSGTANVIGVGGIVGLCSNGITVKNCFNVGQISSLYICGDIVGAGSALNGWVRTANGSYNSVSPQSKILTINSCYNASNSNNNFYGYNMSGYSFDYGYGANAGSFKNIIEISVSNSYNINADTNTNIIQLSENEMKDKDSFVGFDFDTIWDISPNINNGMPYLRDVGNFKPSRKTGDVNGDDEVDFIDAQLIMQYEAGLITLTDEQKAAADVNDDGEIDFLDAQLIMMYEAGLIASL